jgi:hypothetical protein
VRKKDPNWKPKTPQQALRCAHRLALIHVAQEALAEAKPYDGEYTGELGELMAAMVADGLTLDQMDELPKLPPRRVVLRWLTDDQHPFYKLYYEAKKMLVPLYEERAQTVAATPLAGTIRTKRQILDRDGDVVDVEEERVSDNVERSKLIVATLQWSLSHLAPKKHGRIPDLTNTGPNEQLEGLFAALKSGPADG